MGLRGPDSPQTRPSAVYLSSLGTIQSRRWELRSRERRHCRPEHLLGQGGGCCQQSRVSPGLPHEAGPPGTAARPPGAPSEKPCRFCTDLLLQPASHPYFPGTCCASHGGPATGAATPSMRRHRGSKELSDPIPCPPFFSLATPLVGS